jgi:hypothetical protein
MTTDPAALIKLAKCFSCIPKGQRQVVMLYLLCAILQNQGK